ncbi:MAG TPA: DNA polymerase III subunit alpha [Actinomycetes bacterium]|nr:DNA polymerase III subunit alpha [Actinomycetes bacterium]
MAFDQGDFVHLHVASGWSLRHGAAHPQALVERAAELGMAGLALTDRDGVYGAVKFAKAGLVHGVRPVLGVDLAVQPLAPPERDRRGASAPRRRTPVRGGADVDLRLPRVLVLARAGRRTRSRVGAGWAAVNRLVSAVHAAGERGHPVADLDLVAEHAAGGELLVLLGPGSEVGRALAARRPDRARAVLDAWRDRLGGDRVLLEVVSHHGSPDGSPLEQASAPSDVLAARLLGFAREHGVPAVLTNAVRYATPAGAATADVLDATRRLVPLGTRHVDRRSAEAHLKDAAAMRAVAARIAEDPAAARRLLATTEAVAADCLLDPAADLGLGLVHLPEPDLYRADEPADTSGTPPAVVLRARCEAALETRYRGQERAARERLAAELEVIDTLGYWTYFLTVAEVCDLIRSMGVRVAARGSGAGSLVLHLLGVSGVDPLRHGLLMERFLTVRRQALPDVDVDVESARRTEVYERIFERFGDSRCACVSMTDTYRVRHAVRDVGAALGLPPGEIDSIAKAFPHIRARDARAALHDLPELRRSGLAGAGLDTFFGLVESLDGLPRHIALHPCGVLLSDTGLLDRTPVEASLLGFPMSQFDKDDVEDLGLLKLDVLGIRMQSSMAHAVEEVRRVEGVPIRLDDEDCVPRDDPATFALIASARTLGCFQIESPGQRELIGKFGPETFDDLITDISLFRPGPVKSDMVTPFLLARQGWSPASYLHERLRPALEETCGVVVFHEQVIRVIAELTGCALDEADEARRELGSPDGQAAVREWLYPPALARGFTLPEVESVWAVLQAFASFGFCKAHAAAFALPTYQSAWLKAHHPAAFLAGVLTHDPGMYPKRLILDDARQCGVTILGLDVNRSDGVYRVEPVPGGPEPGYGIRLSLADVKGISEEEVDRIVAGRPYAALADFWQRSRTSRPVVERLVVAGAFDGLYGLGAGLPRRRGRVTRRDLLLQVGDLDRWSRSQRRASPAQLALDLGDAPELVNPSGLPEMTGAERVRAELDVLGLDVSRHVVDFYTPLLAALGVTRSRDLLRCRSEAEVLVAGVKVATQTPPVRSGRRVVFLTLDDATGPVDATFFEDAQGPYAATVFHSWLLVVRGHVRRTGPRGVSIRATGAWELAGLHAAWERGGLEAAYAHLAEGSVLADQDDPATQGWAQSRSTRPVPARAPEPERTRAGGMGQRRVLVHASGFRQSPYADVKAPGEDAKRAPRKLWHSSPGSPGG